MATRAEFSSFLFVILSVSPSISYEFADITCSAFTRGTEYIRFHSDYYPPTICSLYAEGSLGRVLPISYPITLFPVNLLMAQNQKVACSVSSPWLPMKPCIRCWKYGYLAVIVQCCAHRVYEQDLKWDLCFPDASLVQTCWFDIFKQSTSQEPNNLTAAVRMRWDGDAI